MRNQDHASTAITAPQSSETQDSLLAFPACGVLFSRLSTEIGRWAQSLIEKQPDMHLWQVALDDAKA